MYTKVYKILGFETYVKVASKFYVLITAANIISFTDFIYIQNELVQHANNS